MLVLLILAIAATSVESIDLKATEQTVVVKKGERAAFLCQLLHSPSPPPEIEWFRSDPNAKPVLIDDSDPKYTIERGAKLNWSKMTIEEVDSSVIKANFSCKVNVANSKPEEIMLTVESHPWISKVEGHKKKLVEGDPLNLVCSVHGRPTPKVLWYKDDHQLTTNHSKVTFSPHEGVDGARLHIRKINKGEEGKYMCNASNKHDYSQQLFTVIVKDKWAALWPFLGICGEVLILCIIIFIHERHHAMRTNQPPREPKTQPAE